MPQISQDVLARLKELVGPKGFIDEPQMMAPYLTEPRGLFRGATPLVLRPATTAEVAAIVKLCFETSTQIVPQAGNTSLVGGAVPRAGGQEILLNVGRMNRIRSVDRLNGAITAEAGCTLATVQAEADAIDLKFPLGMASEGSAQVGGALSTNAGGHAVLRWGSMRELALGLEVVLPDGRIWDGLKSLRKNATGYDLKQLFIGAEGTLGVITSAVLKLVPKPKAVATAIAAVKGPRAAVELLAFFQGASGEQLSAFELIPGLGLELVLRHIPRATDPLPQRHEWLVLLEASGADPGLGALVQAILADALAKGLVDDAVLAQSQAQADAFWLLRNSLPDAQRREGLSIKCDISVPPASVPEFIARARAAVEAALPGVRLVAFGHVGDGNVHFNLMQPLGADGARFLARWEEMSRIVHEAAVALGGSVSAEHGLGQLKIGAALAAKPAIEFELMRRIKRVLDPRHIMNPGKLIPEEAALPGSSADQAV